MHDAYRYQVREVDYNFNTTNPFKGAPIADVEEEWTRLMNGGKKSSERLCAISSKSHRLHSVFNRGRLMQSPPLAHTLRVQEVDMKRMNMSSIQLSDGSGDYLAVPIVSTCQRR